MQIKHHETDLLSRHGEGVQGEVSCSMSVLSWEIPIPSSCPQGCQDTQWQQKTMPSTKLKCAYKWKLGIDVGAATKTLYHYTPARILRRLIIPRLVRDVNQLGLSYTAGGGVNRHNHSSLAVSYKVKHKYTRWPSNITPRFLLKKNECPHKDL